jgi:hypothetical protein
MFSAMSRLTLEGFSCNFIPHTFCIYPVNDASLVIVGHKLRQLYVDKKLHFRQYLGFHWRDFPETSDLALCAQTLETGQLRL